jgi:hypothetical protein
MHGVFRRREPPIDSELLLGLVRMVMRLDAKLDRVLQLLGEDDGQEEMDT